MDTQNVVVDLSGFFPQDTSTMEIMKPGGIEGTGWKIEFAGPAHPKTVAWNDAETRKTLRRQQQIEQAQVNGKKFKSEDREVDEVRRHNVAWVVSRIVSWSEVSFGPGGPVAFSEDVAIDLLIRPQMGWVLTQMLEYLSDERSFTKGSGQISEPSQSDSSPSEH